MAGKAPSPHSRANGAKAKPRYGNTAIQGLNGQPGNPKGGNGRRYINEFVQYASTNDGIEEIDMGETPILDYVKQVALNPDLRHEIRLGAAQIAVRFETPVLASKPYVPTPPPDYRLRHDLKTTASCLEAHRQLSLDVLEGKIAADAATYISVNFILPRIPHLEISEVRQELEAFRQLVEQAKEQRELEARLTTDNTYEVAVVTPEAEPDPAP